MLMIQHWSKALGLFWRPASLSSKLNVACKWEPDTLALYTPVMFRR